MSVVERYLLQLNTEKRRWRRAVTVLTALSLVVVIVTSWNLRMTGITKANGASCGFEEHVHTEECMENGAVVCGKNEHIHGISCYPNTSADIETMLDWQEMFENYPYTGDLRKDLVGIAKTQVGYTESALNFESDSNGVRRGYTRYGAWYGVPYNDWSATFVSFCLAHANADREEYPISSGASTMAELWKEKGRFATLGEYTPESGDIVFFNNNTAGIVAEVYNATFYVIRGDIQNSVRAGVMSLSDASIKGWGITGDKSLPHEPPTDQGVSGDTVLDVSSGPSVQIFEGKTENTPRARAFSTRNARSLTELLPYIESNGGGYFFTLLDHNNMELPKDANGYYIAQANTGYKLTVSFTSPKGFLPGVYQYQIPNGLMVDGGEGSFVLKDGVNVGDWSVTDTGLITLYFNEHMNSRTEITISATLGIHFPETNDPIDFDGKIIVTVEKQPEQQFPTQLYKWGSQGDANSGQNPTKMYWTVQIIGNKDSQIPGNILSDRVLDGEWSKDHRYTASDIAGGLTFGVSEPDPVTGEFKDWHSWHVSADDPHLVWDETSWSYKMPQSAVCQWCGEVILGNENWIYTVNYTSTPDPMGTAGTYGYENQASIDGQHAYAWTDFTHGEARGEISKIGSLVSDASGGNFVWEVQATVPGLKEGQKAEYHWYVMDYMYLLSADGHHVGHVHNDANLSLVTVNYNGTTFKVPRVQDSTPDDMFAFDNAWTAVNGGVSYGREMSLLCKCHCTEETCPFWNNGCAEYWYTADDGTWTKSNGYCQCWAIESNVTFTFAYTTNTLDVVEDHGGFGHSLQNVADLYHIPVGSTVPTLVASDTVAVKIPELFKKELTSDFDGYTAHYKITVNEGKLVLTNGTPLTVHDVMTDTLAYISGSLVITAENAVGHTTTLVQGVDYTVTYDGTGAQTDASGNKAHVLDIVILRPQPVMYILDYDTTLIMPEQFTGGIKYSNYATVTLWGEDITDNAVEKVYADINIATKSYTVDMFKTCSKTQKPLPGATFGLYNAQGGLVTTGITDINGKITFQTNIINGIILREHVLYYLQEITPPAAYQLDSTQYWFCFCSGTSNTCRECAVVLEDLDAIRIPFEQVGIVNISNQPIEEALPATGGRGNQIYIFCGILFMIIPLIYGLSLRHKRERRSSG